MILSVTDLQKTIEEGERQRVLFSGVSLSLEPREFVAIEGRSGSGKSSFLNCIAGLTSYDSGTIKVTGQLMDPRQEERRSRLRLQHIGVVFQFFNLLPSLTLINNILLPARLLGDTPTAAKEKAEHLCEEFGITHCMGKFPTQVSGGEAQRASIARALINEPALVLADEPTGNLDHATAETVLEHLQMALSKRNCALLMVSHDPDVVAKASRRCLLTQGVLQCG